MEYIIGAILFLIVFIILGLILRKRVYDRVDQLEEWKLAVMNKDVTEQLSKIKDLNLSGETQTRFEKWRTEWDHIVTRKMPDIEEELFDAEEAADKYRFRTAKKVLDDVSRTLQTIETSIVTMFEEVEDLILSKEDGHKQVELIRPRIKETRKQLLQNRYQFGNAEIVFEVELDEIEEQLTSFDQLTEHGDYIEAKDMVQQVSDRLEELNNKIKIFPSLYQRCKTDLPEQLDELTSGLKEMKSLGHNLQHFGFEKEIQKYHEQLISIIEQLDRGEVYDVETYIIEIEERIQEIFDQLEQEAIAKQYTEKKMSTMENELLNMEEKFKQTREEVKTLQVSYEMNDEDQETLLTLENQVKQLKLLADKIVNEVEDGKRTYTNIRGDLEHWLLQWDSFELAHNEFLERVNSLRQDEIEAKERINDLLKQIGQVKKNLQKSNIPGVPEYIFDAIKDVTVTIDEINTQLTQHPLNMEKIYHLLGKAEKNTEMVDEQTEYLLEQARLAEYVIQYANRYRSQYPVLAAKLSEAEYAFREWDYELALETAAEHLEQIEPGAIKRLDEILKQEDAFSKV
ncbi:septation ring formation regulator EzrA [Salinibacillus xinjiangensis]|uniref:Septation ring formation regulator EzrA n=1 Tax=Salinibacillus xinjiangensis TaxID=1229268 RepID=A0A6G1X9Y2_9BACI|nr:septation ring formation regulator EzrA [Salinibacillus xinjiangensis]MRG87715.1 septation ring formation regulator EzrA [Salinibacillus xinjiangensis]